MAPSSPAVTLSSVPVRKDNADEERTLQEVSSRVYPKLERVPGKQNWVDHAGGLPSYIERIAKHLHYERGHSIGSSIAMAVNTVKKWAASGRNHNGGKLKPQTVAKAAKAVAQWEAKKAKSKAKTAAKGAKAAAKDIAESETASPEDLVSLGREAEARLVVVEGLLMSLEGEVVKNRAGAVKSANALLEADGGDVEIKIGGGDADRDEMIDARIKLSQEAAELRAIVESATPRISKGDSGGQVLHAQNRLNTLGYKVKPDGEFGPVTDHAVKSFQGDYKLQEDGVIGPDTTVAMRGADPEDAARRRQEREEPQDDDAPEMEGEEQEEEELEEEEMMAANAADEARGQKIADMIEEREQLEEEAAPDKEEEGDEAEKEGNVKPPMEPSEKPWSSTSEKAAEQEDATEPVHNAEEEAKEKQIAEEEEGSPKLQDLMKGVGVGDEKGNKQVADMQSLLDSAGYKLGDAGVDGRFGPDTTKAVKSMQRKHGLKADGVFGQQSRRLLTRIAKRAAKKKQDAGEMKEAANLESMRMPQLADTLRGVDVSEFVEDEQAPHSGINSRYNRLQERLSEAVAKRTEAQRAGDRREYGRWLGRERYFRTKLEETELQEAYLGWEKLVAKLMGQGKSREAAERIAASIGRKKYGKKRFQKAAALGVRASSLKEAHGKGDLPEFMMGQGMKKCPTCGAKLNAKMLKEGKCGAGHSLKAKLKEATLSVDDLAMLEGKYQRCRECGMKLDAKMLEEQSCGMGHSIKAMLKEASTRMDEDMDAAEPTSPPNLRESTNAARSCGTCVYFDGEGRCEAFKVDVDAGMVCDEWGDESSL